MLMAIHQRPFQRRVGAGATGVVTSAEFHSFSLSQICHSTSGVFSFFIRRLAVMLIVHNIKSAVVSRPGSGHLSIEPFLC
jgi:hypothetical protein